MGKAKKIGIGIIVGVVGLFVLSTVWINLWGYYHPEEYAAYQEAEKERKLQELFEDKKKNPEKYGDYNPALVEAKKELDSYLESLNRGIIECNKLPTSEKISPFVKKEAEEIVVNSAAMILLIEEAPIESGLLPYKQKIITGVDELTDCLNRH